MDWVKYIYARGRIAFSLGPLHFHWYGILIVAGALIGAYVSSREAKRRGEDPNHVWDALFYCLLFGVIGARLYHVVSYWQNFAQHPLDILRINTGGLAIYGAAAGGLLATYLYAKLNRLNFLLWADLGSLALILAQAIARWGNLINQELYGYPTYLPWAIPIEPDHCLPELALYEYFHPLFLYESLWNLLSFAIMLTVARRFTARLINGDIVLLYGILYPLGRFFLETLRPGPPGPSWWPFRHPLSSLFLDAAPDPNSWMLGGFRVAQAIAFISILLCTSLLIYRHRRRGAPTQRP